MKTSIRSVTSFLLVFFLSHGLLAQQAIVPGTGTRIDFVGDSFEDTNWSFIHNHPKSSREADERLRFPVGKSTNGRWYEGPERGHPDHMKVVPAPAGALPGSQHALLVQTLNSGIPGIRSFDVQQDDLIVDFFNRIGNIPVSEVPNVTTRVYLPPADQWEDRTGPHFGFRVTTNTTVMKSEPVNQGRLLRRSRTNTYRAKEQYWPGIWIHFRSSTDTDVEQDSAFLTVRGNRLGHDFHVRDISQDEFGWWTFGISVTGDGKVHFYASPGVDELTEEDFLTSQFPYSYRAQVFETMFYNFCNKNDGETWSTPFLIDDPQLFLIHPNRVQSIVERKKAAQVRQAQLKQQQELRNRQKAARVETEKRYQAELARLQNERVQQRMAARVSVVVDDIPKQAPAVVGPVQVDNTEPISEPVKIQPLPELRDPLATN